MSSLSAADSVRPFSLRSERDSVAVGGEPVRAGQGTRVLMR